MNDWLTKAVELRYLRLLQAENMVLSYNGCGVSMYPDLTSANFDIVVEYGSDIPAGEIWEYDPQGLLRTKRYIREFTKREAKAEAINWEAVGD